jgi:hypothetical protein
MNAINVGDYVTVPLAALAAVAHALDGLAVDLGAREDVVALRAAVEALRGAVIEGMGDAPPAGQPGPEDEAGVRVVLAGLGSDDPQDEALVREALGVPSAAPAAAEGPPSRSGPCATPAKPYPGRNVT